MTKLSSRRRATLSRHQADRSAQARRFAELTKAMFSREEEKFTVNRDGDTERLNSVSVEQVAMFLRHRRAFDKQEVLETLNRWSFNYLVSTGYVVKSGQFYWVTEKAAEVYKLPNNTGTDGFNFKFAKSPK